MQSLTYNNVLQDNRIVHCYRVVNLIFYIVITVNVVNLKSGSHENVIKITTLI
ncbi:hypothetical protein Lalb_Chr15g0083551 [Lupinus albus]|uniref:Uncharacterized protein n=1 Tax=Lupinus albus TaxID=3870 RepID=A0A6A4PDF4_LUPAL|nr:hypothetical protein Lalb_Chr15g0083551 [Lupinus albus]